MEHFKFRVALVGDIRTFREVSFAMCSVVKEIQMMFEVGNVQYVWVNDVGPNYDRVRGMEFHGMVVMRGASPPASLLEELTCRVNRGQAWLRAGQREWL